jgi:hypothetical protein
MNPTKCRIEVPQHLAKGRGKRAPPPDQHIIMTGT